MRIAFFGDSLTRGWPGSSALSALRERLPEHCSLSSFGRVNDTIISLHRRVSHLSFEEPFDIAFLWVGVNDVVTDVPWSHRVLASLFGQPRPRDSHEFRTWYEATLHMLCHQATRVVAVSPAIRGENLDNGWNGRLLLYTRIIEDLAPRLQRVEFLDLHDIFAKELDGRTRSRTPPGSAVRAMWDALTARTGDQVDRRSAARGLHLTLDGIHLNTAGAQLAAAAFAQVITARDGRTGGQQRECQRGPDDRL